MLPAMNIKKLNLLMLFILMVPIIYAASSGGSTTVYDYGTNNTANGSSDGYYNMSCNESGKISFISIDIDPYVGVNEYEDIKVTYTNLSNDAILDDDVWVVLDVENASYNMSWVDAEEAWMILLKGNKTDDVKLRVRATASHYECKEINYTIKVRFPYYFTFELYKGESADDTSVKPYINEFQYVYLQFVNKSKRHKIDLNYLDTLFGWMPFYNDAIPDNEIDKTISFYSNYENGEAYIKLYEMPANYTVNLLAVDTKGFDWDYEFILPQFTKKKYDSQVIDNLKVKQRQNVTAKIYISQWEISKFNFMMNVFKYVVIFIIWAVVTFFIAQTSLRAGIAFTIGYFTLIKTLGFVIW